MPDVIIGFVPNDNFNYLAQALVRYLSLFRELHGPDSTVRFPGGMKPWAAQSNDSSQAVIARFAVHASLHPETSAGQSYNIANNAQSSSWSAKWLVVCEYCGLKGASPNSTPGAEPLDYRVEHAEQWEALEMRHGRWESRLGHVRGSSLVSKGVLTYLDQDRPVDLTKTHAAWGTAKMEWESKTRIGRRSIDSGRPRSFPDDVCAVWCFYVLIAADSFLSRIPV